MPFRRSVLTLVLTVASVASINAVEPPPAAAQAGPGWQTTPDVIWDVGNPDTNTVHTATLRAVVRDMEEFEGRMYVAGKFQDVVAPDGSTFSQPYLAAFDLATGEWDSTFRPDVDGIIYAIEITPDGRLYVGGEMTGGAALYDARTGVRTSAFQPQIEISWTDRPAVYDVEVVGNDVYLGGMFTNAQGRSLSNLARVDATSGALDLDWRPRADFDAVTPTWGGSTVFAIAVDESRERVYLAGKFGGIDGNTDAAYFATLRPSDGAPVPGLPQGLPPGIPNHRDGYSMWMEDVQFADERVYVGGNGHQTMLLRASDLGVDATFHSNFGVGDVAGGGDTQVITIGEETVWSGCHCWGSVGPFELGSYIGSPDGVMTENEYQNQWAQDFQNTNPFGQQRVRAGYGIDRTTEQLVPLAFDVQGQAGAYAIVEDSLGRLWFGGQFTNVRSTGRSVEGMVRFSSSDSPAPDVPQLTPPSDEARPADDQIVRLYRAVFGRTPDASGFAYWTDRYRSGLSLRAVADSFATSPEWNSRYGGGLDNGAFVDALYSNVLGRPGDASGRAYWVGGLDAGTFDRLDVLLSFVDSPENIAATGTSPPISVDEARVLRLYRAALGRSPDAGGYSYWVNQYRSGQSLVSMAEQFAASAEWKARYGAGAAPETIVDALYRNVLDRAADGPGRDYWVGQLDRLSLAQIIVEFSNSPENVARTGTVI